MISCFYHFHMFLHYLHSFPQCFAFFTHRFHTHSDDPKRWAPEIRLSTFSRPRAAAAAPSAPPTNADAPRVAAKDGSATASGKVLECYGSIGYLASGNDLT